MGFVSAVDLNQRSSDLIFLWKLRIYPFKKKDMNLGAEIGVRRKKSWRGN